MMILWYTVDTYLICSVNVCKWECCLCHWVFAQSKATIDMKMFHFFIGSHVEVGLGHRLSVVPGHCGLVIGLQLMFVSDPKGLYLNNLTVWSGQQQPGVPLITQTRWRMFDTWKRCFYNNPFVEFLGRSTIIGQVLQNEPNLSVQNKRWQPTAL